MRIYNYNYVDNKRRLRRIKLEKMVINTILTVSGATMIALGLFYL